MDAQAQVIPFALAPALVGADLPIDYSTRAGQALYSQVTTALAYTFEGPSSSLPAFLQSVMDRSTSAGWGDIFEITVGQDAEGADVFRNLLTQYGEITMAHVRENALADYIGQNSRNAQISHQIYQCLRKSVGTTVMDRLVTEQGEFFINGVPDGPSFLMALINVYSVRTNATTATIRVKISEAHLQIADEEYNIDAFNTSIDSYVQKLSANGEQTEDLFAHLARAYKSVPDKEFRSYIGARIDSHNDGSAVMTPRMLMEKAKAKYDELMEADAWMKGDDVERKLVTLTAQLQQMETKAKYPTPKKGKPTPKKGNSKKGKKKQQDTDKWAWKNVKPRSNQAHTKVVEGKTYHWCKHHERWTIHTESECRLNRPVQRDDIATPTQNRRDDVAQLANLRAVLETEGAFDQE